MENQYCYKYPRPALTTDQVIFGFGEGELRVLLSGEGTNRLKGNGLCREVLWIWLKMQKPVPAGSWKKKPD